MVVTIRMRMRRMIMRIMIMMIPHHGVVGNILAPHVCAFSATALRINIFISKTTIICGKNKFWMVFSPFDLQIRAGIFAFLFCI